MIRRLFGMMTFILFFRFLKWGILIGIFVLVLYISNFNVGNLQGGLSWLDEKLGESLNNLNMASTTPRDRQEDDVLPKVSASDLTHEQKEKIDLWLNMNNYNRYGDPSDTYYAGGTPLFDEKTGERIDRYDYILSKRPEIIREVLN